MKPAPNKSRKKPYSACLIYKNKLAADPKALVTKGGLKGCTFAAYHTANMGEPDADGRWINFIAWDKMAEHILENYREGDMISITRSAARPGKTKCPSCKIWIPNIIWTVYELEDLSVPTERMMTESQAQIAAIEESVSEVVFDVDSLPF